MATAARDMRYRGGRSVDGSLAQNLDWAVRERELRHAGEAPLHPEAEKSVPRVRRRAAQRVSVLSVAGFCAVAALFVLVLMQYIQLTTLSTEVVNLRSDLEALQTENVVLTAQYEQIFDLASVREAAAAMGMTKPGSSQIYYVDLPEGDSATVYQEAGPSLLEQLRASLHQEIYAAVEYFD